MINNHLSSNATAGYLSAATVTASTIRNNTGWVTEQFGTSAIANSATTQVVTHGLSATPTAVVVTPLGNEMVWVSARTSTTFTVSRAGSSGSLSFDWSARS
jgi:hypothetical protein